MQGVHIPGSPGTALTESCRLSRASLHTSTLWADTSCECGRMRNGAKARQQGPEDAGSILAKAKHLEASKCILPPAPLGAHASKHCRAVHQHALGGRSKPQPFSWPFRTSTGQCGLRSSELTPQVLEHPAQAPAHPCAGSERCLYRPYTR